MKDVVRCEKLREGANSRRSVDIRMGKPTFDTLKFAPGASRVRISGCQMKVSSPEYIGV